MAPQTPFILQATYGHELTVDGQIRASFEKMYMASMKKEMQMDAEISSIQYSGEHLDSRSARRMRPSSTRVARTRRAVLATDFMSTPRSAACAPHCTCQTD